jgi:hypothetical protein
LIKGSVVGKIEGRFRRAGKNFELFDEDNTT